MWGEWERVCEDRGTDLRAAHLGRDEGAQRELHLADELLRAEEPGHCRVEAHVEHHRLRERRSLCHGTRTDSSLYHGRGARLPLRTTEASRGRTGSGGGGESGARPDGRGRVGTLQEKRNESVARETRGGVLVASGDPDGGGCRRAAPRSRSRRIGHAAAAVPPHLGFFSEQGWGQAARGGHMDRCSL